MAASSLYLQAERTKLESLPFPELRGFAALLFRNDVHDRGRINSLLKAGIMQLLPLD